MNLSKRLDRLASFVSEGNILADIGTDHGFVPIKLVLENKIKKAIAMDINTGPLKKAKQNIEQHKLADKIELRLSDGLDKLKENEADSILIAGMGSDLIVDILTRGESLKSSIKEYILSPHTEWFKLRKFLRENGYQIIKEDMLIDESKYYVIIKAIVSKENKFDEDLKYDLYGRYLIENKNPILKEFLLEDLDSKKELLAKLEKAQSDKALCRKEDLEKDILIIEEVLNEMC